MIGTRCSCAWPVFDDELLPETLRQRLSKQAGYNVGIYARRKADDDPHRTGRVGLRLCGPQARQQTRGTCRKMQKSPTRNVHSEYPRRDLLWT